jgi:hypothetical protein
MDGESTGMWLRGLKTACIISTQEIAPYPLDENTDAGRPLFFVITLRLGRGAAGYISKTGGVIR